MQDFCFTRKILGEDFLHERHVNYLLKSLRKSPLDVAEAHRLSSLFFIVSGLDLLGALDTKLTRAEKDEIIEWIYSYQVDIEQIKIPQNSMRCDQNDIDDDSIDFKSRRIGHSGFRATSMLDSEIPLDCGVLSMTYCALSTLVILGDDLKRVNRKAIIDGLRQLQLPNGSFKPSIIGGENDMRLVYCATAVSQLLNDWSGVNKERCVEFIKASLSYDGAFGQCPGAEAHGGSTYCALAALKLMSKLDETLDKCQIDSLIRWCINRLDHGFSGRPNKDQDTCYSFWIGACLVMLNQFQNIEQKDLLDFILMAQQERGGLSKVPEFYSDPLHTYLGFAGLTFMDDDLCQKRGIDLLRLDPKLNISVRARTFLEKLHESWSNTSGQNEDMIR